ncbi:hypothetical protein NEPAR06_2048 [Nematocida parisii]|nr:uncharacterized protein NEPG_00003 [Nematocida parisii ERTm1]EIJ94481.1 hypothetical protein NEPG_00003 [Nematocida parisii ERTm1]KAI5145391.1 hypothetical protein NEPAR07_1651 [Nematocida parisii]KAI5155776.1 hypothetical protein NEPAR06_2048 [Nematocida parisii]KAI5157001.1 hypothetical protein NEPAR05_0956 [Nematocida parisii]|eukprot:XP_013057837.1 hypothetical protein NEPG_00003 [Nematocida parisii ERTm1]
MNAKVEKSSKTVIVADRQAHQAARQKFQMFVFYFFLLIKLVTASKVEHVCPSIKNIKDFKLTNIKIITEDGEMAVKPGGPLCGLRGRLVSIGNYIENLRHLFPYNIIKNPSNLCGPLQQAEGYKYTAHIKTECTGYNNVQRTYLEKFYKVLEELFPFEKNYLPIITEKLDSFYAFIIKQYTMEEGETILAALFLLAEGVDLDMRINSNMNGDVFILNTCEKDSPLKEFNLSVEDGTSVRNYEEEPHRKKARVCYKAAKEVIMFFMDTKRYREDRASAELQMAETYQEFEKGGFLYTPEFLIQAYVYKLLIFQENRSRFVKKVYFLLNNYINMAIENRKQDDVNALLSVKNRLFNNADESAIEEKLCLELVKEIFDLEDARKLMPFHNKYQIKAAVFYMQPEKSNVNIDATTSNNEQGASGGLDSRPHFVSYIESTILGFFCCCWYDSNKTEYMDICHTNVLQSCKDFFFRYKGRFMVENEKVYYDWNRVIMDVKRSGRTLYIKESGQLCSGLLNILRAISVIAGIYNEEKLHIKDLKNIISSNKPGGKVTFYMKIQIIQYIKHLLFKISGSHNFKVLDFKNIKKEIIHGVEDITGELIIQRLGSVSYGSNLFSCMQGNITIKINTNYATIATENNNSTLLNKNRVGRPSIYNSKKLLNLEENMFMGCLIAHYKHCLMATPQRISIEVSNNIERFCGRCDNLLEHINMYIMSRNFLSVQHQIVVVKEILLNLMKYSIHVEITKYFLCNVLETLFITNGNTLQYYELFPYFIALNDTLPFLNRYIDISMYVNTYDGTKKYIKETKYLLERLANMPSLLPLFNVIIKCASLCKEGGSCFLNSILFHLSTGETIKIISKIMCTEDFMDQINLILSIMNNSHIYHKNHSKKLNTNTFLVFIIGALCQNNNKYTFLIPAFIKKIDINVPIRIDQEFKGLKERDYIKNIIMQLKELNRFEFLLSHEDYIKIYNFIINAYTY